MSQLGLHVIVDADYGKAFRGQRMIWLRRIINGKPVTLYDFNEIREHLRMTGRHDGGLQTVPIEQIVGSVGRSHDFDRAFHPRRESSRDRWTGIARALYEDKYLPPVDLIKVGELYFVVDGHHRISVMKQRGQIDIEAYVTEFDAAVDIRTTTELRQTISNSLLDLEPEQG